MQQNPPQSAAEVKAKADSDRLRAHIMTLTCKSPLGKELVLMGCAATTWEEMAEIMCMLEEVQAHERHICSYCKVAGHKHANCAVYRRIWDVTRGDRAINKKRGHMSAELRFKARTKYRRKKLNVLGVSR